MGHEALIEDLRRKSSERIKQIWLDAETRVEEFRVLKKEEFEQRRAEVMGQLKTETAKVAAPILHEAERSALTIEDEAMSRLSGKLYAMAADMLEQVRQQDYESVFAELVREMPVIAWERVQVNPLDADLASRYFRGSEIEPDPSILGGFIASADQGRYQVVNTLKRRLEKGWPQILPLLLREIIEEYDAFSAS